jgi:hypothetical protein
MKFVWKYDIPVDDLVHTFQVPPGRVVHVGTQDRPDVVQLWMEVDESEQRNARRFQVFGTGHDIPDKSTHVGSVIAHRLPDLVWHVFEVFE